MSIFSEMSDGLASKGFSVIPVRPRSKIPAISNWSDYCQSLPTPELVTAWAANPLNVGIGVCTGPASGIICLDVDLRLEKEEDQTILGQIRELIPPSPVEKVGSKGFTRFYRYDGQTTIRLRVGQRVVLEILSGGAFTVLPPSIHPDTGEPYRWIGNALHEIRPSDLPALDQTVIDQLQSVIASIPAPGNASSRGGRNDALKSQVVAALKKGKGEESIVQEILIYDQRHHNAPLFSDQSDPQMADMSPEENAARFVGNISASLGARSESQNSHETEIAFTSLAELFAEPEEEVRWIVDGLLPSGGVSILAAKPKVGKSTLARQLALSVATGIPFLGREVNKGTVLYLALEEKRSEVKHHFHDMGATSDLGIYITEGLPKGERLDLLLRAIQKYKPSLVIIDTVFRLLQIQDGNNYNAVVATLEPVCSMARASGTHVLLVHHRGKGEKTGGDSILGSTAIFAAVDTAMTMDTREGKRYIKSEQRYGSAWEETELVFDPQGRTLSRGQTRAAADEAQASYRIIDLVRIRGKPLIEKEIISAVGGSTGVMRRVLRSLVATGDLSKSGSGKKGDPFRYSIKAEMPEPRAA